MNYFVFLQAECHESTDKYYMSLLDIILLAVALAMDCLTVSVVSGVIGFTVYSLSSCVPSVASGKAERTDDYTDGSEGLASKSTVNCKPSTVNIRMAFLFGFFQALMPLIGWAGISHFQSYMEAYDHWIAFSLLGFIGGRMVWESFHPEEGQHFNPRRLQTQLLLAIATSIDALAVGISFACTGYEQLSQLWMPLAVIGMVSFLFSLLGYWAGYHFGRGIISRFKPELIGGVILILIGVRILMSHLGYI